MTAQSLGRTSGQASNSSSQSLQDLASEHGPTSNSLKSCPSGTTNTRILNKAMRANSFSLASNSTCPQTVSELSQTRSSSASGGGTWTVQTSKQKQKSTTTNSNNSNISTRTLSSSATSSSFNSDYSDALTLNSSYVDVNDKNNNNDCDREQVAEGGTPGTSCGTPGGTSGGDGDPSSSDQPASCIVLFFFRF